MDDIDTEAGPDAQNGTDLLARLHASGPELDHLLLIIKLKARQLKRSSGIELQDVEDAEQDIYVGVSSRVHGFDAKRASWKTFLNRTVDSATKDFLTAHKAKKRSRCLPILDDSQESAGGVSHQCLTDDVHDHRLGQRRRNEQDAADLRWDTQAIVATLLPDLRQQCQKLPEKSRTRIAKSGGGSRRKVDQQAKEILEVFSNREMHLYIE